MSWTIQCAVAIVIALSSAFGHVAHAQEQTQTSTMPPPPPLPGLPAASVPRTGAPRQVELGLRLNNYAVLGVLPFEFSAHLSRHWCLRFGLGGGSYGLVLWAALALRMPVGDHFALGVSSGLSKLSGFSGEDASYSWWNSELFIELRIASTVVLRPFIGISEPLDASCDREIECDDRLPKRQPLFGASLTFALGRKLRG